MVAAKAVDWAMAATTAVAADLVDRAAGWAVLVTGQVVAAAMAAELGWALAEKAVAVVAERLAAMLAVALISAAVWSVLAAVA